MYVGGMHTFTTLAEKTQSAMCPFSGLVSLSKRKRQTETHDPTVPLSQRFPTDKAAPPHPECLLMTLPPGLVLLLWLSG